MDLNFVPVANNFAEKYRDLVMKCLTSSGISKEELESNPERVTIQTFNTGGMCLNRYFIDKKYAFTMNMKTMPDYATHNFNTLAFRTILWLDVEKGVEDERK